MASVDSLEIQISADARKASAAITTLSNKLDRLTSSLSGVNTRGLATLGAGVNKLANAANNFSRNTKSADFSRIARDLNKFSNIDASKISNASNAISKIGNAMGGIKNIDFGNNAKQLSGLVRSLSQVSKINDSGIKNTTKAIGKIAGAMNGIKGMDFGDNASKIAELSRGLSSLGNKSAVNAVTNIPKLAKSMKDFMSTMSTAPRVSRNLIDMTNALARFARAGSSGGRAANSLGDSISGMGRKISRLPSIMKNFSNATPTIRNFNKNTVYAAGGLKNLKNAILSAVGTIAGGVGAFNLLKESMDLSSDLTEQQNVIDVTFGKYKKSIEDLSKISVPEFGMSELTAKTIAGRFQAMGTAIGYSQKEMSGMSVELTKLAADMASFYNVEQDAVATSLQSIFTGESEPLRKYGLDLTQTTLEEWAHKRGIDAKMQSMSQAEKVMLRYQYVMANTSSAQGDFARTANSWANQTRMLAQSFQQLGSILGGVLINAFKPVVSGLNVIMQKVIDFAKTVSNALGQIFGWTYEEGGGITADAVDNAGDFAYGMDDVADATDKAEKKQKKFNKQFADFDELHNQTTSKDDKDKDKDGSGTSVGELAGLGGAIGGKWKQQESILKKFESDIKSLEQLGEYIGTALTNAMKKIPWNEIYGKASDFGSGLASFLNGLISPELFGELGETVASSLNTALHFIDSFGDTFEWENFGASIAESINRFFKTFDWKLAGKSFATLANGILSAAVKAGKKIKWKKIGKSLATSVKTFFKKFKWNLLPETFNTFANGILDAIIGALDEISISDMKKVAKKIAELIGEVDVGGVTFKMGKIANKLVQDFYTLVSEKSIWSNLGQKIADGINGFFAGMNIKDKETGLTGWQALGKSISDTIIGLGTTITTALKKVDWPAVGQSIANFITSIDWSGIGWTLVDVVESFATALKETLAGAGMNETLADLVVNVGIGGWVIKKLSKALLGKKIKDKVGDDTSVDLSIGAKIKKWLADKSNMAIGKLKKKVSSVVGKITTKIKDVGAKVGNWIAEKVNKSGLKSKIIEKLGKITTKIKDVGAKVGNWIIEKVNKSGLKSKIIEKLGKITTKIKDVGAKVGNWIIEKINESDFTKKIKEKLPSKVNTNKPVEIGANWKPTGLESSINSAIKGLGSFGISLVVTDLIYSGGENTVFAYSNGAVNNAMISELSKKEKEGTITDKEKKELEGLRSNQVNLWEDYIKPAMGNEELNITVGVDTSAIEAAKSALQNTTINAKIDTSDVKNLTDKDVKVTIDGIETPEYKELLKKYNKLKDKDILATMKSRFGEGWDKKYTKWQALKDKSISTAMKVKFADDASKALANNVLLDKYKEINRTVNLTLKANGKKVSGDPLKDIISMSSVWSKKEKGGILKNGVWKNIPQYAAGGFPNHGTLFAAGEAGAEVVGHINGRTEVLNQSQLASVMEASVINASREGNALLRQEINILARQNELLTQILEKETGISSSEMFNAVRSENEKYKKRNGGRSALAY